MSDRSKSSVNWGMVCHAAGFLTYIGLPVVGPLIIWLAKRKTDPVVDAQGKEAVNFNISFTLYAFVSGLLCVVLIGYAMVSVLFLTHVVLVIWAILKSNKGESVHYPFTLRFIN